MTNRRETLLVLLAQAGDRQALGDLLAGIQPALRAYLQVVLRDAATAEDVLQDSFVIAVRKLHSLRDPALFRPWIYRVATREAHRVRVPSDSPLEAVPEPAGSADLHHDLQALLTKARLQAAVATLPDRAREAIALHYLQELTLEATAAVLGVPVGTIKSRVAYGLARLRTMENIE